MLTDCTTLFRELVSLAVTLPVANTNERTMQCRIGQSCSALESILVPVQSALYHVGTGVGSGGTSQLYIHSFDTNVEVQLICDASFLIPFPYTYPLPKSLKP